MATAPHGTSTEQTTQTSDGSTPRVIAIHLKERDRGGHYLCGKPRPGRLLPWAECVALEAAGAAVLQHCPTCEIVHLNRSL